MIHIQFWIRKHIYFQDMLPPVQYSKLKPELEGEHLSKK